MVPPIMQPEIAALLAQPEVRLASEQLQPLLSEVQGFTYRFLDVAAFEALLSEHTSRAMRLYWLELLHRAHLAATTSLLRQDRWLRAAIDTSANCLGFAAAFRGILESAADAWFSLRFVPRFIAEHAAIILRILAGRTPAKVVHISSEVEKCLLHFQFARDNRYGPTGISSTHRPEATTKYLQAFESESLVNLPVLRCYNVLCNLTHPASDSLAFSVKPPVSDKRWQITARTDEDMLREIAVECGPTFVWAVQAPVNLSVLILATINALVIPELHCDFVTRLNLSSIAEWRRIEDLLLSQGFSKHIE